MVTNHNVQDRFEADFAGSNLKDARHNLYNGNIGYAVNTLADENHTPRPLGNAYRYDQLNRLVHAKSFTNLDLQTNAWKDNAPHSQIYENTFSYDLNGNIESQLRRDEGGMTIDDLTYKYDDGTYGRKRNRLYHVNDAVTASAYPDDIDDQGTFDPNAVNENNNYRYDELGRLISDAQENISQIYWRHDDKIALIVKSDTGGGIEFTYDPSGNRLSKAVFTGPQFDPIYTDYYIRDAQGNVLATYRRHFDLDLYQSHYTVAERAIYGSDRMGVYAYNDTVYPIPPNWTDDFRPIHTGHKKYELKNHLGNVMAVVHGRKQAVQGSYGVISHYTAIPAFSGDYSAFGVALRGRGDGDYRYGFQDQEHDTETFRGGSVNYKYRMHRPDLGRFFSVDPLFKKYPHYSTYAFSGNRLIDAVELEGLEPAYINEKNVEISGSDHLNNFNPDFQESYVPHPPRKISDDLFPINNDKLMLKANVSVGFKGLSVPVSEGEFNLTPQGKSLNKPKFTVIKSDVVDRTKDLVIIGGGTITKSATILIDKPVLDSEGNKLMDFQIMTVSERTESFSIGRISIEARDTYVNGRRTGETKFRAGLKLSKGIKVNAGDKSAELKLGVDVKSDYK